MTVIKFRYVDYSYDFKELDSKEETEISIEFTIESSGIVHIDNTQPQAQYLTDNFISHALAEQVINTATQQVPGSLYGRTEVGVAYEICEHAKNVKLSKKFEVTDIGSVTAYTYKTGIHPDYDYNAKFYEAPCFTTLFAVGFELMVDKLYPVFKNRNTLD